MDYPNGSVCHLLCEGFDPLDVFLKDTNILFSVRVGDYTIIWLFFSEVLKVYKHKSARGEKEAKRVSVTRFYC